MGSLRNLNVFFLLLVVISFASAGDILRQSIVFDKNTPDVFYCPQHKPTGLHKMIVVAKPLSRLCQFDGGPIPEDYKRDCFNDIDETEYACKEKHRFMKRINKIEEKNVSKHSKKGKSHKSHKD